MGNRYSKIGEASSLSSRGWVRRKVRGVDYVSMMQLWVVMEMEELGWEFEADRKLGFSWFGGDKRIFGG